MILATASLYLVLVSELNKSTELFLADKLNVLRTMLRERPDDREALEEEVELETAARRYEQFYIRLLDERNSTAPDHTGHGGRARPFAARPADTRDGSET